MLFTTGIHYPYYRTSLTYDKIAKLAYYCQKVDGNMLRSYLRYSRRNSSQFYGWKNNEANDFSSKILFIC